jgi:hypothetical protein
MENNKPRLKFKNAKMTELYEVLQKFILEDMIGGVCSENPEELIIPLKVYTEFNEPIADWHIEIDSNNEIHLMIPYKLAEKVIKCTPYYNDDFSFDD